jgi:MFS family permease
VRWAEPGAERSVEAVDPADSEAIRARVQRRAVPVLVTAQVLGGVGVACGVAVGGLLAEDVSGSTSLSGLAQTMSVLGAALLAVPMARIAGRAGRRPALAWGLGAGVVGGVLAVLAAQMGSFALLLLGMALFGGGTASGMQARYAATDAALPAHRGRDLSVVVWATTVGAVAGPNLSDAGGALGRATGIAELAGPFVFSVVAFGLAALAVLLLLRPDPRSVAAQEFERTAPVGVRMAVRAAVAQRDALLGLTAIGTGHAVMVGVMVMTPVHLRDGGAGLRIIGIVISVHIAGMFAFSPLFGLFADRAGRRAGIGVGVLLLMAALAVAGTAGPHSHGQLGLALTLLGMGWSSCLVAGSTLLTESIEPGVRTGVQGMSDLVMGIAGAASGVLAGPLLAVAGYPSLSVAAAVLLAPVLLLLLRSRRDTPGQGCG